jgi:hypothetical protein
MIEDTAFDMLSCCVFSFKFCSGISSIPDVSSLVCEKYVPCEWLALRHERLRIAHHTRYIISEYRFALMMPIQNAFKN